MDHDIFLPDFDDQEDLHELEVETGITAGGYDNDDTIPYGSRAYA